MKIDLAYGLIVFVGLNVCAIENGNIKKPTIVIAILIRNKAHTLTYFFTLFQQLKYPKDRIRLWIRSDNNVDNSIEILKVWLDEQRSNYHSVNISVDDNSKSGKNEENIADWTSMRIKHVINLREEALEFARDVWADYLFMLDADVFLTNPITLDLLISKNATLVAPMLESDATYSNYWGGMTLNYYYKRTHMYLPILEREKIGCHSVSMIHSAVLINLRKENSDILTYKPDKLENYNGPKDDIITFAIAANSSDVPLYICNDQVYGFIMAPSEDQTGLKEEYQRLTNLKIKVPMKMGEIGCFLSHFKIWNEMIKNNYNKVMVLEDDVYFRPYFRSQLYVIMDELEKLDVKWDLIYLGRKQMLVEAETFVEGSNHLVYAGYSYWTLGYILSGRGAKKLIDARPLDCMVPVDEYLPILSDKHPQKIWMQHFPKRDLIVLSAEPCLIHPTHDIYEKGYVSDTEDSDIIDVGVISGASDDTISL